MCLHYVQFPVFFSFGYRDCTRHILRELLTLHDRYDNSCGRVVLLLSGLIFVLTTLKTIRQEKTVHDVMQSENLLSPSGNID